MARRPRILMAGGIYHVTFRGNGQQDIFADTRDRHKLLEGMEKCCDRYTVDVFLYCMMSNHVHLLLHTPQPNLSKFMATLLTGYTVYFNRKHGRSGHLMQGRFGAQVVFGDDYLLNLSRYIHLNPIKTAYWSERDQDEKRDFLNGYIWSSFQAYTGKKEPQPWLKTGPLLAMLPVPNGSDINDCYRDFVLGGLQVAADDFERALLAPTVAIGPDKTVQELRTRYEEAAGRVSKEDAVLRSERALFDLDFIIQQLGKLKGFDLGKLNRRMLGSRERCVLAIALQKFGGLSQRQIAAHLNLSTGAAVSILMSKHRGDEQVVSWANSLDLLFKG